MNLYVDTSALTKLLLDEDGADEARATWGESNAVIASRLAYVEARAAVAAARRARRLSASAYERAKIRFEVLWAELASVEVGRPVVELAVVVAERHALRANDAVHLASALMVRAPLIATWDRELRRAAEEAGLAVAP